MSHLTYKVDSGPHLGRGSYSFVFKAVEQSTGIAVAIKKCRISLKAKRTVLRHEARVIQLLQGHPGILNFFGYQRVPHFEYIAIERLGEDLNGPRKPGHPLKVGTVARIADQMISALEHLVLHNIVHRDIKPENILLCPLNPSRVCLIDFGIARHLTAADTAPLHRYDQIKSNRNIIGTLHWCSINAHLGFDLRPYDDLESLAYVLLYLLMGDLPWRDSASGESNRKAMTRVLDSKQAFNSSTIPAFTPIIFRELLDFSRTAKSDIKADLAEIRLTMNNLASTLGQIETDPLDFTPDVNTNIFIPDKVELDTAAASDSDSGGESTDSREEYSNSYFNLDIECWDELAGRGRSLTFPTEDADVLDGEIPEIEVIDCLPDWATGKRTKLRKEFARALHADLESGIIGSES